MQHSLPRELRQLSLEVGMVRMAQADSEAFSRLEDRVTSRSYDGAEQP